MRRSTRAAAELVLCGRRPSSPWPAGGAEEAVGLSPESGPAPSVAPGSAPSRDAPWPAHVLVCEHPEHPVLPAVSPAAPGSARAAGAQLQGSVLGRQDRARGSGRSRRRQREASVPHLGHPPTNRARRRPATLLRTAHDTDAAAELSPRRSPRGNGRFWPTVRWPRRPGPQPDQETAKGPRGPRGRRHQRGVAHRATRGARGDRGSTAAAGTRPRLLRGHRRRRGTSAREAVTHPTSSVSSAGGDGHRGRP